MLNITVPWWEMILRAAVVFIFIFLALRLTGKRQIGQLAPFDLVLLLILSNAVQNSMNAGDNSLVGGLISAATLLILDYGLGWITAKNKKAAALLEGRPEILVHNGKVFEQVMAREQINHNELEQALRKEGIVSISEVKYAILENSGSISVIRKK